jgi:hypothetical protein
MLRIPGRVWLLSATLAAAPVFALAQAGIPERIVPCNGINCSLCDLAQLAQNLLNAGIFIAVFLSAILFAYAGWIYMTQETISGQGSAKSMFQNVTFGLIIILGAWLFVDTIMKTMLGGSYLPWNSVCR